MKKLEIPTYRIFIHPQDLADLKGDIWSDEPVPGKLTIGNKKLDIDIVYRGSHIRKSKKKSYHLQFIKPKSFRGAKELHLNSEFNDPSLLRNKLSFDFFSHIGVLTPSAEHFFLILNGRQEGVYLELESVDPSFFQKRNLPLKAIFYAVDGDANFSLISDYEKEAKKSLELGYELKYGMEEDQLFLQEFIYKLNTLGKLDFEKEVGSYLDIEKYLLWLAGAVCTQNYDGFVHNYSLYRNGDTGLFEILPWDYDATWGRDVRGKMMDYNYVRINGFNTLSARLLDVPSFRQLYSQILHQILHHQFTIGFLEPRIKELHAKLRPYVLKDPYKKDDLAQFDSELDFICQFIQNRNNYLKEELKNLQIFE